MAITWVICHCWLPSRDFDTLNCSAGAAHISNIEMEINKARIVPFILGSVFVLLSFTLSRACFAQQVYKCAEPGKPISYQSHPCAAVEPSKTWDASPMREDPYLPARLAQMEREVAARRAARGPYVASIGGGGGGRGGRGVSIPAASSAACAAAKRHRDAVYNAAGHRRTFALSRSYDDAVYNACK